MGKVIFDRNGRTGNIYWVMGAAYAVLLQEGRKPDAEQMATRVTHSGSYDEALEIIAEYVDLVEEHDGYED